MTVPAAVWCVVCGAMPDVAITIERGGAMAHYGACFAHIEQVAARVRDDGLPAPTPAAPVGGDWIDADSTDVLGEVGP